MAAAVAMAAMMAAAAGTAGTAAAAAVVRTAAPEEAQQPVSETRALKTALALPTRVRPHDAVLSQAAAKPPSSRCCPGRVPPLPPLPHPTRPILPSHPPPSHPLPRLAAIPA